MIQIDKRKAKSLLRQVVKETGRDYSTQQCYYTVDQKPSCIIGRALARAGFDWSLVQNEPINGSPIKYPSVLDALAPYVHITPAAVAVFSSAQLVQDGQFTARGQFTTDPDRTWGHALDLALEV